MARSSHCSNRVVLTTGYLGRHVHMGADLCDYSVQPARLPVSLTPSTSHLAGEAKWLTRVPAHPPGGRPLF